MNPTLKKALVGLTWHVLFMVSAFALFALARVVDTAYPVVEDFKITKFVKTPSGIVIEGSMRKVRDCSFNNVTAFTSEGRKVHVQFLDKVPGAPEDSRPVRLQLWGPWEVYSGNSQQVSMYAQHSCHALWTMNTKLIDIPIGAMDEHQRPGPERPSGE